MCFFPIGMVMYSAKSISLFMMSTKKCACTGAMDVVITPGIKFAFDEKPKAFQTNIADSAPAPADVKLTKKWAYFDTAVFTCKDPVDVKPFSVKLVVLGYIFYIGLAVLVIIIFALICLCCKYCKRGKAKRNQKKAKANNRAVLAQQAQVGYVEPPQVMYQPMMPMGSGPYNCQGNMFMPANERGY